MGLMFAAYAISLVFAYKTYKLMKTNPVQESEKTKAMQKQLTKSLTLQVSSYCT